MFTAEQQALLQDAGLRDPEPFLHTDFKRPFVYDPKWGVFYCDSGAHPEVMATLAALHLGEPSLEVAVEHLGFPKYGEYWYDLADYWLEHYHGCYKSSVCIRVSTWDANSLEEWERAVIQAAHRDLLFMRP